MTARTLSPYARVVGRLLPVLGPGGVARLPRGYQRLGRVLVLRLPDELRPHYAQIGDAWHQELGVETVLRHAGRTEGEERRPRVEVIAGGPTETEVRENGIRYRLDAARLMFASGNRTERRRAGALVRPEETVVDLFTGIGYFALPAAVHGRARLVRAVEKNPLAVRFLRENVRVNGVEDRVVTYLGDNRDVDLPLGEADRVFLGYLPSALPWVGRALSLVRPGGWLHVHLVGGTAAGVAGAVERVNQALRAAGGDTDQIEGREVKPYGPGSAHYVVDVRTRGPA